MLSGLAALAVGFVVLAFLLLEPGTTSVDQRFDQTALKYANSQIVWNKGPSVQSTQILPLRRLAAALPRAVQPHLAQDVSPGIPDLIRRFGPNRQVALVVLGGDFNSLPPDEGVVLNGQIVVLVDTARNQAIYLMD